MSVVAAEEHVNELPMEPLWLGVLAFGILLLLLIITLQFDKDR